MDSLRRLRAYLQNMLDYKKYWDSREDGKEKISKIALPVSVVEQIILDLNELEDMFTETIRGGR